MLTKLRIHFQAPQCHLSDMVVEEVTSHVYQHVSLEFRSATDQILPTHKITKGELYCLFCGAEFLYQNANHCGYNSLPFPQKVFHFMSE